MFTPLSAFCRQRTSASEKSEFYSAWLFASGWIRSPFSMKLTGTRWKVDWGNGTVCQKKTIRLSLDVTHFQRIFALCLKKRTVAIYLGGGIVLYDGIRFLYDFIRSINDSYEITPNLVELTKPLFLTRFIARFLPAFVRSLRDFVRVVGLTAIL